MNPILWLRVIIVLALALLIGALLLRRRRKKIHRMAEAQARLDAQERVELKRALRRDLYKAPDVRRSVGADKPSTSKPYRSSTRKANDSEQVWPQTADLFSHGSSTDFSHSRSPDPEPATMRSGGGGDFAGGGASSSWESSSSNSCDSGSSSSDSSSSSCSVD